MKTLATLLLILAASQARAGDTLRVLFVGNSYVQVNNLPSLIADLARDRGHVLHVTDASVGGQSLRGHSTSAGTLNQIRQPGWDFVVLQDQSQMPAFPDAQVARDTYPYAQRLDSLVHVYNPCAKTVFYMTWGRENGDASNCAGFPLICSYEGMDSLLRSRYTIMAQTNKALISPVSVAWRALRNQHPGIGLYQPDESHPSLAGSYAAACTFYTLLFKADPSKITEDAGLNAGDAAIIRSVAKRQVYDSLQKWYAYDVPHAAPTAGFTHTVNGRQLSCINTTAGAGRYRWDFGDGRSDTARSPAHVYSTNGNYTVRMVAWNCGVSDTETRAITIGPTSVSGPGRQPSMIFYPNPATQNLHVQLPRHARLASVRSIHGQLLTSQSLQAQEEISLDVSKLPAGRYMLELLLENGERLHEVFSVVR